MSHTKLTIILIIGIALVSCSKTSTNKSQNNPDNSKATKVAQTQVHKTETIKPYEPKVLAPQEVGTPMQSIKDLDKMIEDYQLGQNLTKEQTLANQSLKQKIIRGTFDIEELCRLSLGAHWHKITEKEQKQFVNLMTTLLETKAIFSKEQLKGANKLYNITYKKEEFDDETKKKATVYTQMQVPKEKMTLDITYKVILTPYGWKIFDVIVDDASLLTNYKFQFDRIITKSGFPDLIGRMEKKLNKIKGKESVSQTKTNPTT